LVIGVDHDHDVGPGLEGQPVTGLLVAPVSVVPGMHVDFDPREGFPNGHGVVAAEVVHEDHLIDQSLLHDLVVGFDQGLGGIVGRHDDNDFVILEHRVGGRLGRWL